MDKKYENYAECVVHSIVEKLISLSITDSYNNYINAKIPEECWDFSKKIINNYLSLEYLTVDRDDIYNPSDISKNDKVSEYNDIDKQSQSTNTDRKKIIEFMSPLKKPEDFISPVKKPLDYTNKISNLNFEPNIDPNIDQNFDSLNNESNNNASNQQEQLTIIDNNSHSVNPDMMGDDYLQSDFQMGRQLFFNNYYRARNNWMVVDEPVNKIR